MNQQNSIQLRDEKAVAISRVQEIVVECSEPGWDGNGAEPISEVAAARAAEFIVALPKGIVMPEFAPEPDGSISLDWIQSRDRLFSLSIGTGSRLAYAWLDGTDRGHAVATFDGESVPWRILDEIRGIMNHASTALRAF